MIGTFVSNVQAHEIAGLYCRDFFVCSRISRVPAPAETACLIADIHMPVMTGLDLYRHLIDRVTHTDNSRDRFSQ